ncbi:GntR family transcriptional regulator [Mesorhizobium sp. BR1-1-16]|uniref:GntR family transcriptional regulator n=1 Tax=Mesorhizobium sp. BR1-1-16 TaxID=2876653 RepID=UPI001CCE262E|nr:GntR family transcriptional regulator [Mesorhizobium sp. BR1-1-16]MBZ9938417.1 GntR family transcriptional regulator [Mesorhizobium sp. BR1-1-16]
MERETAASSDLADMDGTALTLLPARILSRDDGPLYRQVTDLLREPIRGGQLVAGSALPREADIAERFGISLITVRQALRELENEGYIKKRAAKPAVVIAQTPRSKASFGFSSLAAIAESTKDRRIEIRSYRKEKSVQASAVFGLPEDESLYCLRAVLFVGDQPACQCTFYFPVAIGSRLRRSDFDDVVVFRSVQRHLGIKLSGARVSVRAELADAPLARSLDCKAGDPILVTEMVYRSADGEPVELTINKNRADYFSLIFDAPNDIV